MPPALRYKILVHKLVTTVDSRQFDNVTKEKIKKKIRDLLSFTPEDVGAALRGPLKGYRKLVVFDDYRVVYHVLRKQVIVFILTVGIRRDSEVYSEALRRISH